MGSPAPLVMILYTVPRVQRNKSSKSNLGRGPRRGALAHIHRKVPIGYNGTPKICPKSTPLRGPIPKPHHLPHPWTHPTYDAKRHPDPIRRFATMHWTDRPRHVRTYGLTDRPRARESLTTIGRCATRATRPNNNKIRERSTRLCIGGHLYDYLF